MSIDIVVTSAVALPIAPINSGWWRWAVKTNDDLAEEIGWPELAETVAAGELAGTGVGSPARPVKDPNARAAASASSVKRPKAWTWTYRIMAELVMV